MLQASRALHQLLLLKPWPWGVLGCFSTGPGLFLHSPGPQLRACYPSTLFLAPASGLCSCGPDGVPVAPRVSSRVLGYGKSKRLALCSHSLLGAGPEDHCLCGAQMHSDTENLGFVSQHSPCRSGT